MAKVKGVATIKIDDTEHSSVGRAVLFPGGVYRMMPFVEYDEAAWLRATFLASAEVTPDKLHELTSVTIDFVSADNEHFVMRDAFSATPPVIVNGKIRVKFRSKIAKRV